jgi:Tat protein secretion system quality control protein TatD with DNase activity
MKESGVGTIAIGADLETSKEAVKVASENENIWACIGQHPTHNMTETEVNHGSLGSVPRSLGKVGFDEKEFELMLKREKDSMTLDAAIEEACNTHDLQWFKKLMLLKKSIQ